MKKNIGFSALLTLAAAFCLSACAPAAPASTGEAPVTATAETAPAAETAAETAEETAETAAFPVGHLRALQYYESSPRAVYNTVLSGAAEGKPRLQLLQVDLETARRSCLYELEVTGPGSLGTEAVVVPWGDTVCLFAADSLYKIPQEGGEAEVLPLGVSFRPEFADEYAVYAFEYNYPDSRGNGVRMDLETGRCTELTLPYQTWSIYAVGTQRFLLQRLITEAPMPPSSEWQQYQAALQNAVVEYDWYDPATGELEKVMEQPYSGALLPDGSKKRRSFLGRAGDRLYFDWFIGQGETGGTESCALDGTDWQPVPGLSETKQVIWCFTQNGTLRWLMGGGDNGGWICDLPGCEMYPMPQITGANGWPETLVGQDQVMVSQGEEPSVVTGFALISIDDYLAGSTDWTPIENLPAEAGS